MRHTPGDDGFLWRLWFLTALAGCILLAVLQLLGVPID